MMNNLQQILPGFVISPDASFENFFVTDALAVVKESLLQAAKTAPSEPLYLCGIDGVGKSHLLQALCNAVARQGGFALYLPLRELKDFDPADIFDNAEMVECLCVDDIDAVMGLPAWEEALFHLYNNRRQIQKTTVFSASVIVNELTIALPDLRTRLTACLCFQIPLLSDEQKVALVQWRAKSVGMELNDACATFVIQRSGRQLEDLLAVMNRLEKESLIAGRKITIPFIKSVLQW